MPILDAEPSIHPVDLLANAEFGQSVDQAWWVCYTRPRQEKSLARDLVRREIAFYLPLVARRLLVRSRPVHSYVPLFSGYVFVYGSDVDRVRSLATNRIAQILACCDGAQLFRDLKNIQRLIEAGVPLTVEAKLQPGDYFRIRSGPFRDLEGVVDRRKNKTRLLVWVKMLQQGISLEIEDYLLEPISAYRQARRLLSVDSDYDENH
jgi:transcriptional antiterminator RfaH